MYMYYSYAFLGRPSTTTTIYSSQIVLSSHHDIHPMQGGLLIPVSNSFYPIQVVVHRPYPIHRCRSPDAGSAGHPRTATGDRRSTTGLRLGKKLHASPSHQTIDNSRDIHYHPRNTSTLVETGCVHMG